MKIQLLLNIRRFLTEGMDMIVETHKVVTNDIQHKLKDHDDLLNKHGEQLDRIETKLGTRAEKG